MARAGSGWGMAAGGWALLANEAGSSPSACVK